VVDHLSNKSEALSSTPCISKLAILIIITQEKPVSSFRKPALWPRHREAHCCVSRECQKARIKEILKVFPRGKAGPMKSQNQSGFRLSNCKSKSWKTVDPSAQNYRGDDFQPRSLSPTPVYNIASYTIMVTPVSETW
jgi:hypothetical protein